MTGYSPRYFEANLSVEQLRRMTVDQRLDLAAKLTRISIDQTRLRIAKDHPEWNETQVSAEFVRDWYGDELADRYAKEMAKK